MIDALQLAPTSNKSPLAKKPEPYSSSFKETLRQANGSDKEYLETSSNVRDHEETRPDSREEIRRKVAEGKESKGDHRIKIVDSDEEMSIHSPSDCKRSKTLLFNVSQISIFII